MTSSFKQQSVRQEQVRIIKYLTIIVHDYRFSVSNNF